MTKPGARSMFQQYSGKSQSPPLVSGRPHLSADTLSGCVPRFSCLLSMQYWTGRYGHARVPSFL